MPLTAESASPTERQQLRRWIATFFTDRLALSFRADQLLERIVSARPFDFVPNQASVDDALAFLESHHWVKRIPSSTGAAIFFQGSSAGALAVEQGQL